MNAPRILVPFALPLVLGLAALAGPGAAEPPASSPAAAAQASGGGRVIVLGWDGADARTIRELIEKDPDRYPTFARLEREGSFEPLHVEAPPESPVSWAALNTGVNPAKTGVPGFVKRVNTARGPVPALGHLRPETGKLEDFDGTPIPKWPAGQMAAACGAAAFVVFFFLLMPFLRRRIVLAAVIALLVGGGAAYAGWTVRGWLPETYPRTGNPNKARNFWDFAAEAGKKVDVIDAAQAFDMKTPQGARVLGGLGVPDARNGIGEWCIYTTNPKVTGREPQGEESNTAGTLFRVDFQGDTVDTHVYGPKNFWKTDKLQSELEDVKHQLASPSLALEKSIALGEKKREIEDQLRQMKDERTTLPMTIEKDGQKIDVTIGGETQTVGVGEWSDFYHLTFALNPILKVHALTRVLLQSLDEPYFDMYLNVLDIDPRDPPFWQPISEPPSFSSELAQSCDMLYETYGWSTATMPFKDSEISPEALMQEVEFTLGWREQLVKRAMRQGGWDCFVGIFSTTDRVQHMMYQYYDPQHPEYDPAAANREITFFGEKIKLSEAVPAIYHQMDRVVGDIEKEFVGPNDTLLVCSDHGFQSFRRQVNVNNWLAANGYLTVSDPSRAFALGFVDWSKTKAYSLGMGFIYVNEEGREAQGIVPPDQVDPLLAEIKTKLLAATDPDHPDVHFCKDAYITKDIHSGPYLDMEADMLLGFAPTYRVSWSSTSGGLAVKQGQVQPVCTDNDSPWSGGHVSVALPDVSGVFFSNRKVTVPEGGVRLLQIAPTALALLGVPVPAVMDLPPLKFQTAQ